MVLSLLVRCQESVDFLAEKSSSQIVNRPYYYDNCNSPRHPERSEGSPANGTYLKIVPLHGDPSSQAPRDDVGSY